MGEKNQTTGDEAGERAEKLASLRRMVEIGAGKGSARAFTSDQLWVSDVAFLLSELDRCAALSDAFDDMEQQMFATKARAEKAERELRGLADIPAWSARDASLG